MTNRPKRKTKYNGAYWQRFSFYINERNQIITTTTPKKL